MTQAKPRSSLYTTLVFLSLLLTLVTVILSAYIRLSTNGIGCSDWPDCFGQVGALSQYDAMTSFSNARPDLPHGVARALHRVVASILGVLVVLIVISAFRMRKQGGPGLLMPLAVLGLTLFLAILGYSTARGMRTAIRFLVFAVLALAALVLLHGLALFIDAL
jgi:cytochrome c oxidase assembly protein subunit 15